MQISHLHCRSGNCKIMKFTEKTKPHQWLRCSLLKTGRREVPGSILGRASRLSRSESTGRVVTLEIGRREVPC